MVWIKNEIIAKRRNLMDRSKFIDLKNEKILLTKIAGSEQEQDLSENQPVMGLQEYIILSVI